MYVLTRVDPYGFPWQNRRHEHNSAVDTGQAFAAVNPLVDLNFVYDKSFP
jgi:hypothetical protein